jgi:hypothetical protein
MADHWIDAATALSIVAASSSHRQDGAEAIRMRAHAGLIKGKARIYYQGAECAENIIVPKGFWRASGKVGLDQNWTTGDFSTWADDQQVQLQAFGVMFGVPGVLEALPAASRAAAIRQLSVSGNPSWTSAREARRFASTRGGTSIAGADRVLLDHASFGLVTARAVLA